MHMNFSFEVKAIIAAILLAAAIAFLGWLHHKIDKAGYDRAMREVAAKVEADRQAKEAEIAGVGVAFAETAQKERVVTKTIIQQVDHYVPTTDPLLSGGFRMLHDAAAIGKPIDDTSRINAQAVTSQDVARTIAENYADCRYEKERVAALQEIVRTLNGKSK
jgi:hypothetical protein